MTKIINLDDVTKVINGSIILDKLSFSIEKGTFVLVIGSNGSGKSTLVKILAGLYSYNGYININGYRLDNDNINSIRKNVSVILSEMDDNVTMDTVYDVLIMELIHLGKSDAYIRKRVNDICNVFGIRNILYRDMRLISNSERQKVMIAASIMEVPDILILDDYMHQLNVKDKELVIDYLNKLKKKNNLTIIMVTHNMEDVMNSDRVLVLDHGKLVMDGTVLQVFKKKDELESYGVGIPFIIDLSLRLMDKKKIKHIYLDRRKLVDVLWK